MLEFSLLLLAVTAWLALNNWRHGFILVILTGLLQDPLRKLVPGEPVYFVTFAAIVFGAAWLGAVLSRAHLSPNVIPGWQAGLARPFNLFLILVALQGLHSFVRFSSPMMTGIGLLVWLAPVVGVMLTYQFAVRRGMLGVLAWMTFYCAATIVFLTSVFLQSAGVDWPVLGEVGEGIRIYDLGTVLLANSGFFRGSEIAAWHASTVFCFLMVLSLDRKMNSRRFILTLAIGALIVSIGLLTGRRKMLLEVAIFFTAYLGLVAAYQHKRRAQAIAFFVAGIFAFTAVMGFMGADTPREEAQNKELNNYEGYGVRGQSVFEDAPERLVGLGFAPVSWAVNSLGWFGTGLGTGSQGTAGIGENERNLGAAEGGLGKITVELGVPGLLVLGWLLLAGTGHLRRLLRLTTRLSPFHARFAYGMSAFLLAKAASFSVAAQAYSDPFILLIMGIAVGFLLAMPVVARPKMP